MVHLQALVNDGFAFVRSFGMVMAESAPHIYLSALPFAPTSSLIAAQYSQMFPHTLSVKCGKASHWPALELMIQVEENVNTVAFSPDGQHIISGSVDKICVWNAVTGEMVLGTFTGHTDRVSSVAFSPDGQHIVSGSMDKTICVWNAATGDIFAGPFTGHTDPVISVAFSPDGQHIVSGSMDNTICVWNAATEDIFAGPFTGHTDAVSSVAFSPDGQHIVSGTIDATIRIWDITKEGRKHGVVLTDQSVISMNGWISAAGGELLIWIPGQQRRCLHRPSNTWIAGQNETCLDLSKFVHGQNWSSCYLFS